MSILTVLKSDWNILCIEQVEQPTYIRRFIYIINKNAERHKEEIVCYGSSYIVFLTSKNDQRHNVVCMGLLLCPACQQVPLSSCLVSVYPCFSKKQQEALTYSYGVLFSFEYLMHAGLIPPRLSASQIYCKMDQKTFCLLFPEDFPLWIFLGLTSQCFKNMEQYYLTNMCD